MMPIERMRPEDFDAVFRLLSQSFPAGERRDKAGQRALLADSAYHIDILRAPSGGVQALMASWDFGGFVFFEHFAVDPACRNGGIGGQMLDALLARFDKPACLEAELPETELAARRIGFYERHGFTVNADYPYFQPALTPGGSPIPLHLPAARARPPSCARSRRSCTRVCTVKRLPRWYNRKQKVSTPLHGRGRGVPFSIWREKQCRIIVRGGRLCRRP